MKHNGIFYIRDSRRNPVASIMVYRECGCFRIAAAVCHPRDKFKKSMARTILKGRLENTNKYISIPIVELKYYTRLAEKVRGCSILKRILTDLGFDLMNRRGFPNTNGIRWFDFLLNFMEFRESVNTGKP